MLTPQEEEFIRYWETARLQRKSAVWQRGVGLPLLTFLALALFINIASGWYKQADAIIRTNSSVLITVLVATLGIVIFVAVFSARHQWEQKEQHYQELLAKKKAADNNAALPS